MTPRQTRSEVTRRKIIDAAVELFNDVGYSGSVIGDDVDRFAGIAAVHLG